MPVLLVGTWISKPVSDSRSSGIPCSVMLSEEGIQYKALWPKEKVPALSNRGAASRIQGCQEHLQHYA